jgi:hypothetical protein
MKVFANVCLALGALLVGASLVYLLVVQAGHARNVESSAGNVGVEGGR